MFMSAFDLDAQLFPSASLPERPVASMPPPRAPSPQRRDSPPPTHRSPEVRKSVIAPSAASTGKKAGFKQGPVDGVLKELGYTEDQVCSVSVILLIECAHNTCLIGRQVLNLVLHCIPIR